MGPETFHDRYLEWNGRKGIVVGVVSFTAVLVGSHQTVLTVTGSKLSDSRARRRTLCH